jgi:hypothetical protein
MSMTSYDVVNPEQAWKLVHHHLGNRMMVIAEYSGAEIQEHLGKETCERTVEDARAHLIGNLAVIVRRLRRFNHQREARKIGRLMDLLIFRDPAIVKDIIDAEYRALSPLASVFSDAVVRLRTTGSK